MSKELQDLHNRLRKIIINTCNTIGCDACDLKFDLQGKQCSATELQSKIMDIEFKELKHE